jgi:hypothetical protein
MAQYNISSYASLVHALSCGRTGCPCNRAGARRQGLVHCPSHSDRTPSLAIADRGKVLFHCHGGCAQTAVLSALRSRGLWR